MQAREEFDRKWEDLPAVSTMCLIAFIH